LNFQTLRHRRRLAFLPTNHLGDMHGRQQILLQFWQFGILTDLGVWIAAGVVAGSEKEHGAEYQNQAQRVRYADHRLTPTRCRYTSAHPSQPVTGRIKTVTMERTSPIGTTDVQAARV